MWRWGGRLLLSLLHDIVEVGIIIIEIIIIEIVEVGIIIVEIIIIEFVEVGMIIIEIIIIDIVEVGIIIIEIIIIAIVEVGRVRRRRTVRRSTGVGGKAPHLAINFRFGTWRK